MKSNLKITIFFSLFFLFFQIKAKSQMISVKDFQKEFTKSKKALVDYHPGIFYYQNAEDFETLTNSLYKIDKDSIHIDTAYKKILFMFNSIHDLHTSVGLKRAIKKPKLLPLVFRNIGDAFYLAYNNSKDSTLLRGLQVLEIENEPIILIYSKLKKYYSADNFNTVSQNYYAERGFARYYYYEYGQKDSLQVTFKNLRNDSIFVKNVSALLETESNVFFSKRYKNATRKNLNYALADSVNKIGVLDITSFRYKAHKLDVFQLGFKTKLKKAFRSMENQGIKHLIVDFRSNGGGLVNNVGRITKYLAKDNFRLSDSVIIRKEALRKNYPVYKPGRFIFSRIFFKKLNEEQYAHVSKKYNIKPIKKYHFDGDVHVLMDGGSYSATTFTIGLWHDLGIVKSYYGTMPGGADWGSFAGQWANINNKKTKTKLHIPLYKMVHAKTKAAPPTFVIQPDFFVGFNYKDFIKRNDSQLSFVINKIKNTGK